MTTSYDGLADRFAATFGRAPAGVWAAPGRVNLIGEHVDYNDGLVLPFALTQRTYAAAAPRDDGVIAARMLQADGSLSEPIAGLEPGRLTEWPAYVAGVLWALREDGHDVRGMDVLLDGQVPVGAGLSSSAALECAVAVAAAELSGLRLDGAALAKVAQRAENDFVGVPCGLMDQMASMACEAGHALLTTSVRAGRAGAVRAAGVGAGPARHRHEGEALGRRRRLCRPTEHLRGSREDPWRAVVAGHLTGRAGRRAEPARGRRRAPGAARGDRDRPGRGRSRRPARRPVAAARRADDRLARLVARQLRGERGRARRCGRHSARRGCARRPDDRRRLRRVGDRPGAGRLRGPSPRCRQ